MGDPDRRTHIRLRLSRPATLVGQAGSLPPLSPAISPRAGQPCLRTSLSCAGGIAFAASAAGGSAYVDVRQKAPTSGRRLEAARPRIAFFFLL